MPGSAWYYECCLRDFWAPHWRLSSHDIEVFEVGTPQPEPSIGVPPDAQDFAGLHAVPVSQGSRMQTFILTCCNAKGWRIPTSCASCSQQASPTTPSLWYQGLPCTARSWTKAGNHFHKPLSSFPASWLSAALYILCALIAT